VGKNEKEKRKRKKEVETSGKKVRTFSKFFLNKHFSSFFFSFTQALKK